MKIYFLENFQDTEKRIKIQKIQVINCYLVKLCALL